MKLLTDTNNNSADQAESEHRELQNNTVAGNFAGGTYIYKLEAGDFTSVNDSGEIRVFPP